MGPFAQVCVEGCHPWRRVRTYVARTRRASLAGAETASAQRHDGPTCRGRRQAATTAGRGGGRPVRWAAGVVFTAPPALPRHAGRRQGVLRIHALGTAVPGGAGAQPAHRITAAGRNHSSACDASVLTYAARRSLLHLITFASQVFALLKLLRALLAAQWATRAAWNSATGRTYHSTTA